ncbi:MAG: penicillin-insensitive murein endopeptidase [Polyangiaceae bacterium]
MARLLALFAVALAGCASAPSPLVPGWRGSIGTPGHGVLAGGTELPADGPGLQWLRKNDRHWAIPRFAAAIQRAAMAVARERPGAKLRAGDLSTRDGGGPTPPHFSHRSGMDADLLFYVTTLEGAPVDSPGFVHFGSDGLARDEVGKRWLRLDVEREWLLIRTLLEDPDARIQWLFVSDVVQAMLVEWACARGESPEIVRRAQMTMAQPNPGGVHDDHVHVRTACSPEEVATGCQPAGPRRPWLQYDLPSVDDSDADLAQELARPIDPVPKSLPMPSAQLMP